METWQALKSWMSAMRDLNFKVANYCIANFYAGAGDQLGAEITLKYTAFSLACIKSVNLQLTGVLA